MRVPARCLSAAGLRYKGRRRFDREGPRARPTPKTTVTKTLMTRRGSHTEHYAPSRQTCRRAAAAARRSAASPTIQNDDSTFHFFGSSVALGSDREELAAARRRHARGGTVARLADAAVALVDFGQRVSGTLLSQHLLELIDCKAEATAAAVASPRGPYHYDGTGRRTPRRRSSQPTSTTTDESRLRRRRSPHGRRPRFRRPPPTGRRAAPPDAHRPRRMTGLLRDRLIEHIVLEITPMHWPRFGIAARDAAAHAAFAAITDTYITRRT